MKSVHSAFRMVREQGCHLLLALEILLLGIVKPGFLEYLLPGVEADQVVVGRAVFLVHEMDVVGGHYLHPHLFRQLEYTFVADLLLLVHLQRQPGDFGLVEHNLEVVVV